MDVVLRVVPHYQQRCFLIYFLKVLEKKKKKPSPWCGFPPSTCLHTSPLADLGQGVNSDRNRLRSVIHAGLQVAAHQYSTVLLSFTMRNWANRDEWCHIEWITLLSYNTKNGELCKNIMDDENLLLFILQEIRKYSIPHSLNCSSSLCCNFTTMTCMTCENILKNDAQPSQHQLC